MNSTTVQPVAELREEAAAGARAEIARGKTRRTGDEESLLPVLTLVLWLVCLSIGVIGLCIPYPKPVSHVKVPPPPVQTLSVELTDDVVPPPASRHLPPPDVPPVMPSTPVMPNAPPLAAVAEPNPNIAFAVPVEGPARIVSVREAGNIHPEKPVANVASAPSVQKLVMGVGEGRQPAPEYPPAAERDGQEGTVIVQFQVGEDGRVVEAESVGKSTWPMLTREAVRTVRHRWRFTPGTERTYEVEIKFNLTKKDL